MVSPKTQKIFVTLIVLLFVGFLGYRLFTAEPDILVESTSSETDKTGQDILLLVQKFDGISLDQKIFSDPLFKNLKDFSQVILPESRGRQNPFATIGSDSSSSVNQAQSSATSTVSTSVPKR